MERRGRGSNGYEEKVTIATRFPASLLMAALGGLSSDVVVVVRVIVELVIGLSFAVLRRRHQTPQSLIAVFMPWNE
jgi:hypothetical protein